MCLEATTPEQLVEWLFLSVLSRPPNKRELTAFTDLIEPGFDMRRTGKLRATPLPLSDFQPDWKKHLQAEQTQLMMEAQKRVARGEAPTERLTDDFRERVEDSLWALINSPEFFYLP
jgi:hypothetical protein